MLMRPADRPLDENEWRQCLADHDFGQLIVPASDGGLPIVVPTHFVLDSEGCVVFHLAKDNPAFEALGDARQALFTVIGAYTYIPTYWNASPGSDAIYGIPTSYYAAVQLACDTAVVHEPGGLAQILALQLAHFQPEGGHAPVEPGGQPYGRALESIRGVRLTVRSVRAKFKFGGNKPAPHRIAIADGLRDRGRELDLEARGHLLRRLQAQETGGRPE